MAIWTPWENTSIHKENIEVNENNIKDFILYWNDNWKRAYYKFDKINKPEDIKTFLKENPNWGFEYKNVRYSFQEIISENENEYKILCHWKFLWDEFESHTMQIWEIELTLKINKEELSDKTDWILKIIWSNIKKLID